MRRSAPPLSVARTHGPPQALVPDIVIPLKPFEVTRYILFLVYPSGLASFIFATWQCADARLPRRRAAPARQPKR
eukprot:6201377-Pleurochrysis_carterae.AAC.1